MAPSHSEDLFLVEITTDGTGPFACFLSCCTTSRSVYRDLWPGSDRTIIVQLFWSIIYMSSHVSPRFCSERSPGNADTGPQGVPSQDPSRRAWQRPGLRFWAQLWQRRVPRGGVGTEGFQPSQPSARAGLRISCGLRITDIFSFSQKIHVLRCSWCHFAARLSQPPGFCKVLVLLLGVRRSPRAPLPAGGSSRGSCSLCFSYCLLLSWLYPELGQGSPSSLSSQFSCTE